MLSIWLLPIWFLSLGGGWDFLPMVMGMHLPDGYLSPGVLLACGVGAIALLALSLNRVQAQYAERTVPLMGVCAAFIFAAQMINFPVPGGTSGHLLGGTLAGVLLGPWAGSLVMSVVFLVQALVFRDGGVLALGANVVNMGLIGTFGGYWLYRGLRRSLGQHRAWAILSASAIAAWMSVVVAALAVAVQLGLSGTVPMGAAIAAMIGWHVVIGLGEALITVLVVRYLLLTRPDLLHQPPRPHRPAQTLS